MFKRVVDRVVSTVFFGFCCWFSFLWLVKANQSIGWSTIGGALLSFLISLAFLCVVLPSFICVVFASLGYGPRLLIRRFVAGDTLFSRGEKVRLLEKDFYIWRWDRRSWHLYSHWVSPDPDPFAAMALGGPAKRRRIVCVLVSKASDSIDRFKWN